MKAPLLLTAALLGAAPALAQSVTDGSDSAVGAEDAKAVFALIGKGMKDPASALYAQLRQGRSGALCGAVDATNRMGAHTGPRPFVADLSMGFGGILPDAPELRNPSSTARYQAMQRVLDLHRANCAAE
ncbi:hypothetical protein [Methylobacterium haplocladii]|uniref:Rap1a immunity protein domain-containing protein n=1 Tax=Methylobacterium haplocladii TaxID=1176176 RepID=A0A512IU88_9HYPH|nr:hypothetical protein [Methylobacterium haplocladii]GEP01272.1 hypothetical protein MHA02_36590 [Methylobacterium haplocladii]GJD86133.1 hypothetical protein HPGCJGGD_4030 [Methylobacterium haplocladii]GLS60759.1 hypothetical protein GCM10007887_34460 [Methylobacterium haplocladii]